MSPEDEILTFQRYLIDLIGGGAVVSRNGINGILVYGTQVLAATPIDDASWSYTVQFGTDSSEPASCLLAEVSDPSEQLGVGLYRLPTPNDPTLWIVVRTKLTLDEQRQVASGRILPR